MNSLVNYGSDDDYDDSSEEKQQDWRGSGSKEKASSSRQTDANYEEVQMELSEESSDSKPEAQKESSRRSRERDSRSRHERREREGKSRSDHSHRRDRDRDRKARRSSSRERRRSPRRERSRSRDRPRKHSKRYERSARTETTHKPAAEEEKQTTDNSRFFMPGITGRFRDQIERRKQLWQKKDAEPEDNNKKVWETTTFAQDADGRVANKFKRLMGIRGATQSAGQGTDVLRKQEEMFSSMEQQYEVARTATHTMRGVGLGFGSYQR